MTDRFEEMRVFAAVVEAGGFLRALFEVRYPAPGAPALAEPASALLGEAGMRAGRSAGCWRWTPTLSTEGERCACEAVEGR